MEIIKHYSFSELKDFITRGRRDGNVGWLLMSTIDGISKYRGYGTIENPSRELMTISFKYHPLFDDNYRQLIDKYTYKLIDLNK